MSPMAISWIVFACVFGGALLGIFLRSVVPEHHLNADSKDVVKLGMGLIATMSALVLALLIASAKNSHDTQSGEVIQMSADFIQLDRVLARYGPETRDARILLRALIARGIGTTTAQGNYPANLGSTAVNAGRGTVLEKMQQLTPRYRLPTRAPRASDADRPDLAHSRSLLLEQLPAVPYRCRF